MHDMETGFWPADPAGIWMLIPYFPENFNENRKNQALEWAQGGYVLSHLLKLDHRVDQNATVK